MLRLHASAFAYRGAGCLVVGASGSGKSRLLAEALLHGAEMIADDQVQLRAEGGTLFAAAPPALAGVLELRGLGLIRIPAETTRAEHPLHLQLTLSVGVPERLPEPQHTTHLGIAIPSLTLAAPLHPPSLLLYLDALGEGRILPTDWAPFSP